MSQLRFSRLFQSSPRTGLTLAAVAVAVSASAGCLQVLGLGDYKEGGGGGGSGSVTGSTGSGPSGTGNTNSSGSGQGGAGCTDGQTQPCYDGMPAATLDVGACHGGTQACMGGAWGACKMEVVPAMEDVQSWTNENCKLDVSELVLDKGYPGLSDQEVNSLHVFQDGSFVVGGFTNGTLNFGGADVVGSDDYDSAWFARLDKDLTHQWSVGFPNFSPLLHFASFDDYHGYFTGTVQVATTFAGTSFPADTDVIVEMDLMNGSVTKAAALGGSMKPTVVDQSNLYGVLRTGTSTIWKHFSGVTAQQQVTINGPAPFYAESFGGDFNYDYLAGSFTTSLAFVGSATTIASSSATGSAAFVAKIKADGTAAQILQIPVNGNADVRAAVYGTSGFYVVGTFVGSLPNPADPTNPTISGDGRDIYVARFINVGNTLTPVWAKGFPGQGDPSPFAIAIAADSTVLVSTQVSGPSDFGSGVLPADPSDGVLAAYDTSGKPLYSRVLHALVFNMEAGMNGDTYMGCAYEAGTTMGATGIQAFGGMTLPPVAASEICLGRLAGPAAPP